METYIALFRGINVGGHGRLPMKDLAATLTTLGCSEVRTYIQSGNAVFKCKPSKAKKLASSIPPSISATHGFTPHVIILNKEHFAKAVSENPFPKAEAEPKSLHLFFLDSIPKQPNWDRIMMLKAEDENFRLIDRRFYLHAPNGIGRSKLAAGVEKAMGVPTTARNWRTVLAIAELAGR